MSSISTAISGISAGIESIKKALGAKISMEVSAQFQEVASRLLSASQAALAVSEKNLALQEELTSLNRLCTQLQQEKTKLTEWKKETLHYSVKEVGTGAFVYIHQRSGDHDSGLAEPDYWLCCHCFDKGVKSILQNAGMKGTDRVYRCHTCDSSIHIYVSSPVVVRSRPPRGAF